MIRTLTFRTLLLIVLIAILAFASGFLVPLRVIAASDPARNSTATFRTFFTAHRS